MSLPSHINAFNAPTGSNEPQGIIYEIRKLVTNDLIENFVSAKTNGSFTGNENGPIKLNCQCQSRPEESYYQIEFKNTFLFPTFYSLKGHGAAYSKEWNLYGFNYENEKHTLLSADTSVGSTYCVGNNWGTFKIKNTPRKGFRFFRFTHPKYRNFLLSGIDFFGILSSKNMFYKTIPSKSCFNSALLLIIVICLS